MKKLLILAVAALFAITMTSVVAASSGPSGPAGKSNNANLYLYEKNPSTWSIVEGGAWGKMTYRVSGATFDFVFNGHGLDASTGFSLIYYADGWPGNHPGALIAAGATDSLGDIHLRDSVNLGIDLPTPPDTNVGGYNAKIWLVLSSDYNSSTKSMTVWNPAAYLFESEGITYDDTDV